MRLTTMAKEKSKPVQAVDELQASLRPFLKELGFRAPAFNRTTSDGITQVIEFQRARFEPPGAPICGIPPEPVWKIYGQRWSLRSAVPCVRLHRRWQPIVIFMSMSMTAGFARGWGFWGPSGRTFGGTSRQCTSRLQKCFAESKEMRYLSSQSSKPVMRFSTHGCRKARWKRIPISAGSPAAGRTLLVQ